MWYPNVTVAAVCESGGRFLMVEEKTKSSSKIVLNQPAGHVENGETILQAVIRETLEETCCHFTPEAMLGFYRWRVSDSKTYLRYTFCGSVSAPDETATLDDDIITTHWLDIDTLRSQTNLRSPLVLSCINDYLKGIRFPLNCLREINDVKQRDV